MTARKPGGDTPVPPAKLARIQASLERQGVTFLGGDSGAELARALGAEAVYWPEVGRPGFIVWGPAPSYAAVIEELIHLGQHRRSGWQDVTRRIPELEVAAQERLIRLGERWDWSGAELDRLRRARDRWKART